LAVAADLSCELGKNPAKPAIPTLSLWPHIRDYNNALNSFNLEAISKMPRSRQELSRAGTWNILIVDDATSSGNSLEDARSYIKSRLTGVKSMIATAALEVQSGKKQIHLPDYYGFLGSDVKKYDGDDED
jgi:hypoxanthine phosphoribosyltransferase